MLSESVSLCTQGQPSTTTKINTKLNNKIFALTQSLYYLLCHTPLIIQHSSHICIHQFFVISLVVGKQYEESILSETVSPTVTYVVGWYATHAIYYINTWFLTFKRRFSDVSMLMSYYKIIYPSISNRNLLFV